MPSHTRRLVLWISAPVVAFAIIGGFLSKVTAREDTYQHLKHLRRCREPDLQQLRREGRRRQGDARRDARPGRQPRPRQRLPVADQVKQVESGAALPAGDVGLDLTRQYYLRVIAARDGSPAAKAGLRTGDYVRAIDGKPTREMSVWEGMRALRGAPGTKVSLTIIPRQRQRSARHRADPRGDADRRRHRPDRRAGRRLRADRGDRAAHRRPGQDADRRADQGRRHQADRRRAPHLGRLARRRHRAGAAVRRQRHAGDARNQGQRARNDRRREPATARSRCRRPSSSTPARRAPPSCSPSALVGNKRAELIGEHTIGRAGVAAPGQAARRQRPVAHDDPLPHAGRHAAARKGARADRRRRRARRRVRSAAADRRSGSREGARADLDASVKKAA